MLVVVRLTETLAGWLISAEFPHSIGCWALIGVSSWFAAVAVAADITSVVASTLVFFLAFLLSFLTAFTAFPFLLPVWKS